MMRQLLAVTGLAALVLAFGHARATPLDEATCGLLKGELSLLEEAGVRDSMAKGPEWAKANLDVEKLKKIRRLMELDEQLLFRCPGRDLVNLSGDDEDDNNKDAAKAGDDKTKATPAKKPVAAKKEAPAPAVKKEPAAKPKPQPKPKAKAKVDDAYRPPPVDPKVDPFANKPARQ